MLVNDEGCVEERTTKWYCAFNYAFSSNEKLQRRREEMQILLSYVVHEL